MKTLYISVAIAVSALAITFQAEQNYKDALYAVSVESDGTDMDNVRIMKQYGFIVDGTEIEPPTMAEKLSALKRIPKFRNH